MAQNGKRSSTEYRVKELDDDGLLRLCDFLSSMIQIRNEKVRKIYGISLPIYEVYKEFVFYAEKELLQRTIACTERTTEIYLRTRDKLATAFE